MNNRSKLTNLNFLTGIFILTLLWAAPALAAESTAAAPTKGLVAYWSLDKIENGKVADLSGNGHDGTVINAKFTTRGRINGCLSFNGKDAYVDCGPASSFGISEAMTASVWVRSEESPAERNRYLGFRENGTGDLANGFGMGCEMGTTAVGCWLANMETQKRYAFNCITYEKPRVWTHVAVTYSSNGGITVFHNGKRAQHEGAFTGPIGTGEANFRIGSDTIFWMCGLLDEVRIYDRVLSDDEIEQLSQALPQIPVTGISLKQKPELLPVNAQMRLEYAIEPWHARNLNVKWHSSDSEVATVTETGDVRGLQPGKATVTVTTVDGGFSDSCVLNVRVQPVARVTLDKREARVEEGRTLTVKATIDPANATNRELNWHSSAPDIAAVDENGTISGLSSGVATISATAVDGGGAVGTCTVTVWKTPVAAIAYDRPQVTLEAGTWTQLAVEVQPANASRRNILRFISSDPAVASVDQTGIVIARSAGTADITVEAKDGGFTANCTVMVPPFGSGVWSKTIVLREYLKDFHPAWPVLQNGWWDFPEQLVSYDLSFPQNTVRANGLRVMTTDGTPLEYQLSDIHNNGQGFLEEAVLSFRTGLKRGEIKGFIIDYDPKYDHQASDTHQITITPSGEHTAIVAANHQQIEVPYGRVAYAGGRPASEVLPPIIGISRDGNTWTGPASFKAPAGLSVVSVSGSPVEQGQLRLRYQVEYEFAGGRKYRIVLTIQHNDRFVKVDEYLDGFQPGDDTWLKFSFKKGIDPDGRLVETNSTYKSTYYRGHFDHNLRADGRLPYELGLYTANSYGLTKATVFWKDAGDEALVFSLRRIEDWKTSRRLFWTSFGPQNLAFYCTPDDKYMITRLEGAERHWAIGVIPRTDVMLRGNSDERYAGETWLVNKDFTGFPGLIDDYYYYRWSYGPEVRLFRRFSDHNLNTYKDQVYNWEETKWLDLPADVTAADFVTERARKLWKIYLAESDAWMPHRSMMAGQPNFVIYCKLHLAQALSQWPHHPHAPRWKAEFMRFFREWLDLYVRKADPAHNALGGRHTENLPCYSLYSMMAVYDAAQSLKEYDGTDLFAMKEVREWVRWYLYTLMPTQNGVRLFPPQGAHASGGLPPEDNPHFQSDSYRPTMVKIARILQNGADKPLGDTLLWSLTKGTKQEEGSPDIKLESTLFTDYGAVLWYDFAGPHQAYVNIQQLNDSGYRWTADNNGMIYYCSKGDKWSWNGDEESGDYFNIKQLTVFNLNGRSLGEHKVDGVLYNFGGAQFYRAAGSYAPYLSRGVMMLRDNYIAVYDDVDGDATGTFQWKGGEPQIYPVKTGPGDNLHIVAPQKTDVAAKPWGAIVNGTEYVLMADRNEKVDEGELHFNGRTGYAAKNQLALFEGTSLRLGQFAISREGGDFGVSARLDANGTIDGRITGTKGGMITVIAPGLEAGKIRVKVQGQTVPHKALEGGIAFNVGVSVQDGCKEYRIEQK